MTASSWAADSEMRRRLAPSATVGGREVMRDLALIATAQGGAPTDDGENPALTRYRGEIDTAVLDNTLGQGARITYIVYKDRDASSKALALASTSAQVDALNSRGAAQIYFIDLVDDSSSYYLKQGCQSGPRVLQSSGYSAPPTSIEWTSRSISLYLFNQDSMPLATANIQTPIGSVSYVIAAKQNGAVKLFLLTADGSGPGERSPRRSRRPGRPRAWSC